jgi:hypothetical protein
MELLSYPDGNSKLASFVASISIYELTVVLFVSFVMMRFGQKITQPFFSPLRDLNGPKGGYLFGNLKDIRSLGNGVWQEKMIETYGSVVVFRKLRGVCSADLRVVSKLIFSHPLEGLFTINCGYKSH